MCARPRTLCCNLFSVPFDQVDIGLPSWRPPSSQGRRS
nr:MAG TPA: hypothetical protein [Caudoviricetes sp.]